MDFIYSGGMKTFRVVLGILAVIPLALLADSFLHSTNYGEGSLGELLFPLIGFPIMISNY